MDIKLEEPISERILKLSPYIQEARDMLYAKLSQYYEPSEQVSIGRLVEYNEYVHTGGWVMDRKLGKMQPIVRSYISFHLESHGFGIQILEVITAFYNKYVDRGAYDNPRHKYSVSLQPRIRGEKHYIDVEFSVRD